MPKAKKPQIADSSLPGVGTYDDQILKVKTKMPSFKMSIRTESFFEKKLREEQNYPGPGKYDPYKSSLSNIKYSIPKELRKQETGTNMSYTDR